MNLTRDTLFEILSVSSTGALIKCSDVCEYFNKVTIYDYLWKQKCHRDIDYRLFKQLYKDNYMDCYIKWYKLGNLKSKLKYKYGVYEHSMYELYNLHRLDLSENYISKIPKDISQLLNLQEFLLFHNQISEIPQELIHMNIQY